MAAINLGMPRPRGEGWHTDALCAQVDGDLWFPEKGDAHGADKAKAFCVTCPVVNECLDYAMDNNIKHGVWGNKTPDQRTRMRNKKAA
jgi:WhiB family redox-sensing transcriptional regulator